MFSSGQIGASEEYRKVTMRLSKDVTCSPPELFHTMIVFSSQPNLSVKSEYSSCGCMLMPFRCVVSHHRFLSPSPTSLTDLNFCGLAVSTPCHLASRACVDHDIDPRMSTSALTGRFIRFRFGFVVLRRIDLRIATRRHASSSAPRSGLAQSSSSFL